MLHPSGPRRRLVAAALLACFAAASHAQVDPSRPSLQADDTFRQVMQQPQDAALVARYARQLAAEGNFEGGIAAMERLLLEPSTTPELVMEVAQYYERLGSYGMAEELLRRALADQRLVGERRAAAERLMREVQRRNQRNQFAGSATFGLRHQTNPGYRSREALVLAGGVLVPLPPGQAPDSDWDFGLGVQGRHEYDLDLQNSATIASTFGAYLVDYHSSKGSTLVANPTSAQDIGLGEATVGLRFRPAPERLSGLTLRPHVLLSYVAVQRRSYMRTAGLGLDAGYRLDDRTQFSATLDSVEREFSERIDLPGASAYDGRLTSLRLRAVHEWRPGQWLSGDYAYRRNRTNAAAYDFDMHEARVAYTIAYASPVAGLGPWTTMVWAGYLRRDFDVADATLTPFDVRSDTERRIGVQQTIAFADRWSLVLSLEHGRSGSSLPNYRWRNTSAFAGVSYSF